MKLFCVPYAGGSTSIFSRWRDRLDTTIQLHPIELAGRGTRFREPLCTNLSELLDDVYNLIGKDVDDGPYALFGHSLGSWIIFELYFRLMQFGHRLPVHMFFAGNRAPHLRSKQVLHKLSASRFVDEITRLGGTPVSMLHNRELLQTFVPILRADIKIAETYERGKRDQQIYCNMSVLYGKDDDITMDEVRPWSSYDKPGNELIFQLENNFDFIHYFWACVLGGIIPVPLSIGNNDEHRMKLFRVFQILNDPYLIIDEKLLDLIKKFGANKNLTEQLEAMLQKTLEIESLNNSETKGEIFNAEPRDIAFIQYSSGSTGDPKGVVLTHENLISNTLALANCSNLHAGDKVLNWMPLTHDMGLIGFHLSCTVAQANQYLMPNKLFVRNPVLWLKKASEHRATILYCTNFGLQYLLTFYDSEVAKDWDLSSVRLIPNGAEPISTKLCNEFLDAMAKHGLKRTAMFTVYGLAEACVAVAFPLVEQEFKSVSVDRRFLNVSEQVKEIGDNDQHSLTFVEVGYGIDDCAVRICDAQNIPLEDYKVGFIQIKGKNVTCGYYNNPTATAQVLTPDGWLNTGDLGFWRNGSLVVTGRAKDIIFINGQNIYPHDIERVIEEIEGVELGKVAACSVPNPQLGTEEIVVFVRFKGKIEKFVHLATTIKKMVNEKMDLAVQEVIPIREIPKTTSGKVQRYKLSEMFQKGKFTEILAKLQKIVQRVSQNTGSQQFKLLGREDGKYTKNEYQLAQIWSEVLGVTTIGIYDNFYELGGDSISMMKIISQLKARLNINLSFNSYINGGCIFRIAQLMNENDLQKSVPEYPRLVPDSTNIHEPFPLTEVQFAYFMGRNTKFELGGVSTHLYFEIESKLNVNRLNISLQKLILRHHMLRAVFLPSGEQTILATIPEYTIAVWDISDLPVAEQHKAILVEREKSSHQVFKVDQWPLFEFKACKLHKDTNYLFIGFDMLIADGTSLQVIGQELMSYYDDPELQLPEVGLTFKDYMAAYAEFKNSSTYQRDKQYWLQKLEDFPMAPALPLKTNPTNIDKPRFKRLQKVLAKNVWDAIKQTAQKSNISPSALLCTAYVEVLAFWSNQSKLAVNLTVFNRYPFHDDVDKIVGDFTSVMLLGISLEPGASFWEKAKHVQCVMLEALEHRHYDGIEFIRQISRQHSLGNKAVMPVVFTSMLFNSGENSPDGWSKLGEMSWVSSQTPQVYLDHQAIVMNGELSISWDFVDQLFNEDDISTMFEQFMGIIAHLIEADTEYILNPSPQNMTLISGYNATDEAIIPTTLQQLFINQVAKTPMNVAVEFQTKFLTYEELHRKSNQVAHYLMEQGIGGGNLVAVLAERCEHTIVNILGILKVGAAYVPVEPEYPQERKDYIMRDSNCKLMLKPDVYVKENIGRYSTEEILVNGIDDVAYVIYTSGSTGRPKGVVITHRAATNTIIDINQRFNVNENDRILGISSMCFDLSVYDIFGALSTGATLIMIPDQKDVRCLIDAVRHKNITIWNSVPAIMGMVLDNLNISME